MSASPAVLAVADAADQLGVAPARVRALVGAGALQPAPDDADAVLADGIGELVRRGTLRVLDVAAVEAALDRSLRRRLPGLLDDRLDSALGQALRPLAGEVATAFADVEFSVQQLAAAQERAERAEQRALTAEEALAQARIRAAVLQAQVAQLQARPVGLFRRRRGAPAMPATG